MWDRNLLGDEHSSFPTSGGDPSWPHLKERCLSCCWTLSFLGEHGEVHGVHILLLPCSGFTSNGGVRVGSIYWVLATSNADKTCSVLPPGQGILCVDQGVLEGNASTCRPKMTERSWLLLLFNSLGSPLGNSAVSHANQPRISLTCFAPAGVTPMCQSQAKGESLFNEAEWDGAPQK